MSAPNILLFIADGLRGQALVPGAEAVAPHVRALAARGVQVANAYTPLPTCSPASPPNAAPPRLPRVSLSPAF